MSKKSKFKSYDKSGTYAGFTVRTLFDKRGHLKEVGVEKVRIRRSPRPASPR